MPALPRVYDAMIAALGNARELGDGELCGCCPWCGGSTEDKYSFSIKLDPDPGEPIKYICFRASCGKKGILKTSDLEEIGITDPAVHMELMSWNNKIRPGIEKGFRSRVNKDFVLVNVSTSENKKKLAYINGRLGTRLKVEDLSALKIQLGILDMLRLNDIRDLMASKGKVEALDRYCIGFISIYRDYMICRDITPDMKTGKRYYNYQIAGKKDKDALKIYSIPRDIDIMDPHSTVINVAEGPFSILGAYMNTDLGRERPNSIWLANCGSFFDNTIMQVCKQYGLLRVRLNIWSDSEIEQSKYKKLYQSLRSRLDIRSMVVYYNSAADDFGHRKDEIQITKSTII